MVKVNKPYRDARRNLSRIFSNDIKRHYDAMLSDMTSHIIGSELFIELPDAIFNTILEPCLQFVGKAIEPASADSVIFYSQLSYGLDNYAAWKGKELLFGLSTMEKLVLLMRSIYASFEEFRKYNPSCQFVGNEGYFLKLDFAFYNLRLTEYGHKAVKHGRLEAIERDYLGDLLSLGNQEWRNFGEGDYE
jgi:hypothetical protein